MRHENPIAKQAVKLVIRFTLGKGIDFVVKEPESDKIVKEIWDDPINQMVLFEHQVMQQRLDETITDGEVFFAMATSPGVAPYVHLSTIPVEEIVDTIYDPENRHIPVYYKRSYIPKVYDAQMNQGQGGWKNKSNQPIIKYYLDYRITQKQLSDIELNIPESMIEQDIYVRHRMINPVKTKRGMRGVSELYASRDWIRVFKEFMEDRGAINATANALSYLRKVKGGATAVASVSGRIGEMSVGPSSSPYDVPRLSRPIAGSILDVNEAIDITALRADTGAVDAVQDGRLLLMTAGAGLSTNIHYFGEGGDANLATAQAMELPMVKSYEDWQQFQQEDLQAVLAFGIKVAKGADEFSEVEEDAYEIAWQFPAIITEDVVKYTTAWAQLTQQIAPGNPVVHNIAIRGAMSALHVPNIDAVMPEIIAEEEKLTELREQERLLRMQGMQQNQEQPGGGPPRDINQPKLKEGQKVGSGGSAPPLGPDAQRITQGKPPRIPASGPRSKQ
jgi:hypothetical protein